MKTKTRKNKQKRGGGIALSKTSNLFRAIIDNDIDRVKKLLDKGANVNSIYDDETTLMNAGTKEMVNLLIERGANINLQVSNGSTIAHFAALQGDYTMLLILLSASVNMNIRDKYGRTPLMYASRRSAVDNIMIIIDYGKDGLLEGVTNFKEYINAKDIEGKTAYDMVGVENLMWEGWIQRIKRELKEAGATNLTNEDENIGFLPIPRNENGSINTIMYDSIKENNIMVNFNDEYKRGRYYKKSSYNLLPEPKKNPFTGKKITKIRTYKAKLVKR